MDALLSVVFAITAAVAGGDRSIDRDVVVASDSGSIRHSLIACGSEYQSRPSACHTLEQQRIDSRLRRQLIDAARTAHAIVLTPEELADVERRVSKNRQFSESAAAHFRALALATVRIRRGEDRSLVYAEAREHGIGSQELDRELELRPTLETAERVARKDFRKEVEESGREYYTRRHVIDHLARIVAARAAQQNIPFQEAEEQFWSEIVKSTHTRIVDPSYRLPALKGVLITHEQQLQITHEQQLQIPR